MHTSEALTQETIFGVADGATYSGMLCMRRDGQRYFFSQTQVDGQSIDLKREDFASREDALKALASAATALRGPLGAVKP